MGDPGLFALQIPDPDTPLPSEIAPPRVWRTSAYGARQAVAHIEDVIAVDEEATRLAVVRPDMQERPFLVEHLDPAVPTVGDEDATLRIHLDVVRITEACRLLAFGADATPNG